MYLHAVHARFFAQLCRLRKGAHHLFDLLFRDGAALHVLRPARGQGGGRRADIGYVDDGSHERAEHSVFQEGDKWICDCEGTPESRRQLNEQLRARLVDLLHIRFELAEHSLIFIQPASAHKVFERSNAGNDEPDVVFRAFQKELRGDFIEVIRLHPAEQRRSAHRAENDPVFDLYVPYFPWRKEGFVFCVHKSPPYLLRLL